MISGAPWFRAPVYQSMMVITFIFVCLGLATDVWLRLWQEGETTLKLYLFTWLIRASFIVIAGYIVSSFTPLRQYVHRVIRSWNFCEIIFVISFIWVCSSICCNVKSVINMSNPFYADPVLDRVERFIHFGKAPAEWFYQNFSQPWIINMSLTVYGAWFFIGLGFLVLNIFGIRGERGRERALISFVMCWLVNGAILATILSSTGPIFWHEFYPGLTNIYEGYVNNLIDNYSIYNDLYQLLLKLVLLPPNVEINGISAMPSLHISILALIWLHAREYVRPIRYICLLWMMLTLVACIVLMTHYAIDGYVSIVTTWLIWRWSARYDSNTAKRQKNVNS